MMIWLHGFYIMIKFNTFRQVFASFDRKNMQKLSPVLYHNSSSLEMLVMSSLMVSRSDPVVWTEPSPRHPERLDLTQLSSNFISFSSRKRRLSIFFRPGTWKSPLAPEINGIHDIISEHPTNQGHPRATTPSKTYEHISSTCSPGASLAVKLP